MSQTSTGGANYPHSETSPITHEAEQNSAVQRKTAGTGATVGVVDKTANQVYLLQKMTDEQRKEQIALARNQLQKRIQILAEGDYDAMDTIIDEELTIDEECADLAEEFMIGLLNAGYVSFGWDIFVVLVNLQNERMPAYISEFFYYFQILHSHTPLTDETIESVTVEDFATVNHGLSTIVNRYVLDSTSGAQGIYSSLLPVAGFLGQEESVAQLYKKGLVAKEESIALLYAKYLYESNRFDEIESKVQGDITSEQSVLFHQYMLSACLQRKDLSSAEIHRQKVVALFTLQGREIPVFPVYSQLGYSSGVTQLSQLQEEFAGKVHPSGISRMLNAEVRQSYGETLSHIRCFIESPQRLTATEVVVMENELLACQFRAIELVSVDAAVEYVSILKGLMSTEVGQNFLHGFYLKYASSGVINSLVTLSREIDMGDMGDGSTPRIKTTGSDLGASQAGGFPLLRDTDEIQMKLARIRPELHLQYFVFAHCIRIAKFLCYQKDVPLLDQIHQLLVSVGNQYDIHVDGDVPEIQSIEDTSLALKKYPERFTQLPKYLQESTFKLESEIIAEGGESAIRSAIAAIETSNASGQIPTAAMLVASVRYALIYGVDTTLIVGLGNLPPVQDMTAEEVGMLAAFVVYCNNYSVEMLTYINSIFLHWLSVSNGSIDCIELLFDYLVNLVDRDDIGENRLMESLISSILVEYGDEDSETFTRFSDFSEILDTLVSAFAEKPYPKARLRSILSRVEYLNGDYIKALQYLDASDDAVFGFEDSAISKLFKDGEQVVGLDFQAGENNPDTTSERQIDVFGNISFREKIAQKIRVFSDVSIQSTIESWKTTGSTQVLREALGVLAKEGDWNVFDSLVSSAHLQGLDVLADAYSIALDILVESPYFPQKTLEVIKKLYALPVERTTSIPHSLRIRIYDWSYQAFHGEFDYVLNYEESLLVLTILCLEYYPERKPVEKLLDMYWMLIEKALVHASREDLLTLLRHYERRFNGHITVDVDNPETVPEFIDAVKDDMESFAGIIQAKEMAFSHTYQIAFFQKLTHILETVFKNEEYAQAIYARIAIIEHISEQDNDSRGLNSPRSLGILPHNFVQNTSRYIQ